MSSTPAVAMGRAAVMFAAVTGLSGGQIGFAEGAGGAEHPVDAQLEAIRAQPDGNDLRAAVDAYVRPYVLSHGFSGAVLVASGDEILVDSGYGSANLEHGVPITPQTRFQIGSISKTFPAAAILLLAEGDSINLQDPVSRFIPGFPNGEAMTVHHLLSHTSGLPRFVFQPDYQERTRQHFSAMDLVEWTVEIPPAAAPGERSAYSNANYAVLAAIIEKASGLDYGAFLDAEILGPLGLDGTGHAENAQEIVPNLASGYQPVGRSGFERARDFDYSSATGAGSLYSTTHDLLRWYRSLRRGDLLDEEHRALLFSRGSGATTYAWRVTEVGGRDAVGAQGWDGVGFSAKLVHLEDEDLSVIVLCNLNISGISSELTANLSGIALGEDPEPLELAEEPGDPSVMKKLAGTYRFGPDFYVPNTTIVFAERGGRLFVEGPQPGALLRVSETEFIHRQHWLRITFDLDEAGSANGIDYGGFKAQREAGN